jgi:flagellar motor component MotA
MERLHALDDQEVQLGTNLGAAFIATCQGIGLDYVRKKYAGQPVGEYWITLAR